MSIIPVNRAVGIQKIVAQICQLATVWEIFKNVIDNIARRTAFLL